MQFVGSFLHSSQGGRRRNEPARSTVPDSQASGDAAGGIYPKSERGDSITRRRKPGRTRLPCELPEANPLQPLQFVHPCANSCSPGFLLGIRRRSSSAGQRLNLRGRSSLDEARRGRASNQARLVIVSMVGVREMRMGVCQRVVVMLMSVFRPRFNGPLVLVLMVLVVHMFVLVVQRLVRVLMLVPLR